MGGLPPIPPGDHFWPTQRWVCLLWPPLASPGWALDPPGAPLPPPPGTPEGPWGSIWLPPWIPWIRPCWAAPFGPLYTISSKPSNRKKTIKDHGFFMVLGAPRLSKRDPWKKKDSPGPPSVPPRVNGSSPNGSRGPPGKWRAPPRGSPGPPRGPKFSRKTRPGPPPGPLCHSLKNDVFPQENHTF